MTERAKLRAFRFGLAPLLAVSLALDALGIRLELAALARAHSGVLKVAVNLVLFNLGTPLAVVLAAALLWRGQRRPENRLLALFLALVAFLLSSDAFWWWRSIAHPPAWTGLAMDNLNAFASIASVAALLRFSSVFPLPLEPRHLTGPGPLRRLRSALLRPRIVWLLAVGFYVVLLLSWQLAELFGHAPAEPLTVALRMLAVAVLIAGVAAAVANLRTGARFADPAERRRLFWLIEGFLAGVAILVLGGALRLAAPLVGGTALRGAFGFALYLALLVILAGLAIAMFFSGALDPGLAIRRTAVFGLVGLTMVFVFAGVENAMQNVVADRLGMSDHLSGLISGGLVALTFDPIKERFNRLVGRWSGRSEHGRAREVHARPADVGAGHPTRHS